MNDLRNFSHFRNIPITLKLRILDVHHIEIIVISTFKIDRVESVIAGRNFTFCDKVNQTGVYTGCLNQVNLYSEQLIRMTV